MGEGNMTPTGIDAQMLVSGNIGGTCNGGNPTQVYKYAHDMGLVHGSCEQYVAHNLESEFTAIDICKDCVPPVPMVGDDGQAGCFAVTPSKMYYVDNYYSVRGEENMKAALQDGPISCGNYWGIYGFFYMKMGGDNLSIETDCIAGDVT